jgi:hypothetical protein
VPADEGSLSRHTTTDWDARNYDRLAAPQEEWARKVLERLPLEGDETVLDAGCGSGRATKLLLDKLPDGRVIGVDGSPSMIEVARESVRGRRPGRADHLGSARPGAGPDPGRGRCGRCRLGLLQRDVPLDPRPRPALLAPAIRHPPGRQAGRSMRRPRQREGVGQGRQGSLGRAAVRSSRRGLRSVELLRAGGDREQASAAQGSTRSTVGSSRSRSSSRRTGATSSRRVASPPTGRGCPRT